jgi:putative transposase
MVACIDAHRDRFGVEPICRVLRQEGYGIAPSTYYAARSRPPSARTVRDAWLEGEIVRVFKASGERSGARKVWWDLHREHIAVGRCTVERLMRRLGLRGVRRGGYKVVTTVPDSSQDRPGDLVDRDFCAVAPNRLWVVDFTYVATWAGTVYTALVIDAFSRMIVGWRTAGHHRMTLVLDALVMAVAARRREGVTVAGAIHHSDAGSEYLAIRYGRELTAAGMTPSVGSVGDSYDNALAESIIGLYKTEVIAHQGPWRDLAQVETATATWVGWFNQQRLFWPIGRRPPAEYEQAYHADELDPAALTSGRKTPGKSTRKTKKTT